MIFPGNASPRGRHAGAYDPSTSLTRRTVRFFLVLVLMIALAWPFVEPFLLQTEHTTLTAADLPASIGQLRIVYASDIHKGGIFGDKRVASLVSHINACNADIVLFGGDYAVDIDGAIEFFQTMPRIHSRYGVYAVLGNHDRTVPESKLTTLRSAMQNAGVMPLINAVTQVRIGMSSITIVGIDDADNGRPDMKGVASQVRAEDYVIFLSHNPKVIPDALKLQDMNGREGWFDLGLFGHTHGGQVAFLGAFLKNDGVPDEYTQGWFRQNRAHMLVSRGVGTSGLPVRLFCMPQIHLITVNTAK
ncbi:MAG: metallophosphoesterase [Clostridiales bacterium]|nr:metallophosphoesterase [Clostridiales bacterium]